MKFSEKWLREWVDPPVSTEELVEQLTMAGLEVEATGPVAPELDGVVVGRVLTVAAHPDADKLRVCQVDVGEPQPLQIVCGAPNVAEGMFVPTARVGAYLPAEIRIERARLRGVESEGMLCSAVELGLAEQAEGLMSLGDDAQPGQSLVECLDLDDTSVELSLTPNRGDCLGLAGVAREVGVLTRCAVVGPTIQPVPESIADTLPVTVQAPADCPRYVGRVIRGVDPGAPTPMWMQERLRRSGLRSLGPIVDVTNYVLLELGQPMHAFDLARLHGGIVVRHAEAGETLRLLDGRDLALEAGALVIADRARPLALAGIMGGEDSAVSSATGDLFLESAFFAPMAIAGRARACGLHTDSSHRFERGVDPELQRRAVDRATRLLLDIVGGEPGPVIEVVSAPDLPQRAPVSLRAKRIERVLGIAVEPQGVADVLARLGMNVEAAEGGWRVTAPGFRFDIALEVDLIEEIGRIHGYARLPSQRPRGRLVMAAQPEAAVPVSRLRRLLVDRGYHEAITYSFVDPRVQETLEPGVAPVALANPLSTELSVMRTSLWPGLLQAVLHNQRRQQKRLRLFEVGRSFLPGPDGAPVEEPSIAGAACGPALVAQWGVSTQNVDFFDLKMDLEAILGLTGRGQDFIFTPTTHSALHPGQAANIQRDGRVVGRFGALHPRCEGVLELDGPVYVFELSLAALSKGGIPAFRELSKFPSIRRDVAVLLDVSVTADAVCDCIRRAGGVWLRDVQLFDVYTGEGIDLGKKSVALGLTLQETSRTLTDEEVDSALERIVRALSEELSAELRR